jgi:hypothetical protein
MRRAAFTVGKKGKERKGKEGEILEGRVHMNDITS